MDVIREIVADKLATIILVTHETEFAKEISDKVYFMEKGLIVESGSPEKIFTNKEAGNACSCYGYGQILSMKGHHYEFWII
ncbi:hypothetical protein [Facklamia hominis]|uniref:hypothetical protein n=1 Tax=Facklamia hominis TaxID=178214 RepID=UPI0015E13704|nr:hypothetical protein [Facklamia hominis]